MVTLAIITIVALIVCLSKINAKNDSGIERWAIMFCVSFVMILVSGVVSECNVPTSMEQVQNSPSYYADGTSIYKQVHKASLWIPFAPCTYEMCDEPHGYCSNCHAIYKTPYCMDCGKKLNQGNNACANCGTICNSDFCGQCGSKIEIGE